MTQHTCTAIVALNLHLEHETHHTLIAMYGNKQIKPTRMTLVTLCPCGCLEGRVEGW